jgi:hypothetical protein
MKTASGTGERKNGCGTTRGEGARTSCAPESYKPHYYSPDGCYCRRFVVFGGAWLCVSSGMESRRCVSREHSRLETLWMAGSRTGSWNAGVGGASGRISKSNQRRPAWIVGRLSRCARLDAAHQIWMQRGAVALTVAVAVASAIAILCASCRLRGSRATLSTGYRRHARGV